jgi:6-phosphogluconolactonase
MIVRHDHWPFAARAIFGATMQIHTYATADEVAQQAAKLVATMARAVVQERGRFVMAVSGGQTPWQMLRALVNENVPWQQLHVFQVDERIAPEGDPDRNFTHLRECLAPAPLPEANLHPMPVNAADLVAATDEYAESIRNVTGGDGVFDLIHLGLGADGHTASLVPGDPVLDFDDRDVALCGVYQGRRRMTLTYPILNRAKAILWLATGSSKVEMLRRLQALDKTIPAGLVRGEQATILADAAAIG